MLGLVHLRLRVLRRVRLDHLRDLLDLHKTEEEQKDDDHHQDEGNYDVINYDS